MEGPHYKYVVLVVCFLLNMQSASSISCLGLFMVEFMEYFHGVSATSITWIAGTHMGITAVSGMLSGILLKRYGPRVVGMGAALISTTGFMLAAFINNIYCLYFTFGLMAGIGQSTYYGIANSTVQLYFSRWRALTCAVALTGFSVGGFAWPPFCRWLIDRLCWQETLVVFAAFHLQFVVLCALLRPNHIEGSECSKEDHSKKESVDMDVDAMLNCDPVLEDSEVKCKRTLKPEIAVTPCCGRIHWVVVTVIYCAGVCFGVFLHVGVIVYTPVRSWRLGLTKTQGALLVSIINIHGGVVRIPAGFVGDLKYVNRGFLLSASLAIVGVLTLGSKLDSSFLWLAIYSGVYGAFSAVYLALQAVVLSDIAGVDHLAVAMGMMLSGHGLSSLTLHPIAGAIMDWTDDVNNVFTTLGTVGLCGSSLVLLSVLLKGRSSRPNDLKTTKSDRGVSARTEQSSL